MAHEEGNLNDIRAVLGNDVAIKTYKESKLPFPDGAIIAHLAWSYVASEENNKVFGHARQSSRLCLYPLCTLNIADQEVTWAKR